MSGDLSNMNKNSSHDNNDINNFHSVNSGLSSTASSSISNQLSSNKRVKSWLQLKTLVEFSRKIMSNLNGDIPSNISFREFFNKQTQQVENRIYFLGGTQNREITIKYIDVAINKLAQQQQSNDKLYGSIIFNNSLNSLSTEKAQLTKEEQLLRERKRCSFNGITSYCMDDPSGRLVFSERSELFYFDDEIPNIKNDLPNFISTSCKGALDVKICPVNSNLITYILNDNLWLQDLNQKLEIQLTNTSDPLKSGVPSYAVQEEFNRYTGYWWQPVVDSGHNTTTFRIIYEEINDQDVNLTYITPSCENEFGYDTYRYPKAGTPNSKTYLKMVEIIYSNDNKDQPPVVKHKKMAKSFYELFNWYEYLVKGDWVSNGEFFWVKIYDRLQMHTATLLLPLDYFINEYSEDGLLLDDEMQTSTYETAKNVILILEQTSNTWINYHNIMYFLDDILGDDGHKMLSFISASDETGFLHLYNYKVSLDSKDFVQYSDGVIRAKNVISKQLTDGDWCIEYDENVSVDKESHLVYFTAYKNPLESHLFVVDYVNNIMRQLTTDGFSHAISINKKCNLFVTICSNLSTPYKTYIYEIGNQQNGIEKLTVKQIAQLISKDESKNFDQFITNDLMNLFLKINLLLNLNIDSFPSTGQSDEMTLMQNLFKPPQIFTFLTSDNSTKIYGMIYMPFNYDHDVKYPTVLYVYGGPKAQIVTNSYKANKYSRFNILALLGYCVVVIDSRGSDYRGQDFEAHLNRKMGTVEISDQVAGLEAASNIFNCIDMKRVAIYGWSYGGYMALMGLAQRSDIFKVAISGAPVTSWGLYDTAYTERYMGIPDDNKEAYYKGSVLSYIKSFPDEENRLLIIHGMIDENVHFAHTRQLVDALIKENKPYQLQIYPNERHGIRSPEASIHCDINFYSFLERNLV